MCKLHDSKFDDICTPGGARTLTVIASDAVSPTPLSPLHMYSPLELVITLSSCRSAPPTTLLVTMTPSLHQDTAGAGTPSPSHLRLSCEPALTVTSPVCPPPEMDTWAGAKTDTLVVIMVTPPDTVSVSHV